MKPPGLLNALTVTAAMATMDSDIERRVIASGTSGTNGTLADMCKNTDVSYCIATDTPDAVTMTCTK